MFLAEAEETRQRWRKGLGLFESGHPAIRNPGQGRVGLRSEASDEPRQRVRKVLVLADAKSMLRHIHPLAEACGLRVQTNECSAFLGRENPRQRGIALRPQRLFDGLPAELR